MANDFAETFGTKLYHGTAGGAASTLISGIDSVRGGVKKVVSKIDITRIDQASRVKQYTPGLIEPGGLQVTFGFLKTLITTLEGFGTTLKSWKILYSDGSSRTFDGFIEGIGDSYEGQNGEVLFDIDIAVSGVTTFTAAA